MPLFKKNNNLITDSTLGTNESTVYLNLLFRYLLLIIFLLPRFLSKNITFTFFITYRFMFYMHMKALFIFTFKTAF